MLGGLTLDPIASLDVHLLRLHPDVRHHGDARCCECGDVRRVRCAPFELHRVRAGLDKPLAVCDGEFRSRRGAKWKIGEDERTLRSAGDRACVVEHLVHRHERRIRVAEHDHAERIADKQNVHAGLIKQARHRVVVRGEHGDAFAAVAGGLESEDAFVHARARSKGEARTRPSEIAVRNQFEPRMDTKEHEWNEDVVV